MIDLQKRKIMHITNLISQYFGKFAKKEFPLFIQKIINASYVKLMGLDMKEFKNARYYKSLNDLFTRELIIKREIDEAYDVIITDSNDPIGPSKVLFTETYYGYCKKLLRKKGILVVQNGDFFMQPKEYQTTFSHLQLLFRDVSFYLANVPTYIGSYMTLGFASDIEYRNLTLDTLNQRFAQTPIHTFYYHPSMHKASFILPKAMQEILDSLQNITSP